MASARGLNRRQYGFVDGLLVAEFEILQSIRLGMAVLDSAPAPFGVGGPVGVLDEIRQVLRRFVEVEVDDRQDPGRLAKVEEFDDAPTIRGVRIPEASVRRAAVARADHVLPSVSVGVSHKAAQPHDGHPLANESLRHVPAHGQALEPAPWPRLQQSVPEDNRSGRPNRDGEPTGLIGLRRRECEFVPLPFGPRDRDRCLGICAGAVAALRGSVDCRWLVRPHPEVALVGLSGDEAHPSSVEAHVLHADRPVAALKEMRWLCDPV